MQCLECSHPTLSPGLVVAMEQRQHLALERNAQICGECAEGLFGLLHEAGHAGRFWIQCVNCALCGGRLPAMRLRFELKKTGLKHVALCSDCYGRIRPSILLRSPNLVAWVDKEWETTEPGARKMPWPRGTVVRVRHHVPRFHDRVGVVESFRGLVQPFYGYEVRFEKHLHHFFHERDLEPLVEKTAPPAAA